MNTFLIVENFGNFFSAYTVTNDGFWLLQAYQVELEAMAVRLEEENEQLLKEKVMQCYYRRISLGFGKVFCFPV
mgnify:CR=1 FL=1